MEIECGKNGKFGFGEYGSGSRFWNFGDKKIAEELADILVRLRSVAWRGKSKQKKFKTNDINQDFELEF